jgi:hypothetical protein
LSKNGTFALNVILWLHFSAELGGEVLLLFEVLEVFNKILFAVASTVVLVTSQQIIMWLEHKLKAKEAVKKSES